MDSTEQAELGSLCHLHTGYTARTKLEPASSGGLLALQLRDIPDGGDLDPVGLQRFSLEDLPSRYLVMPGDVIFRSRGIRNTACTVGESFGEPAVALLPLIVIRPKTPNLLPHYVTWAINQPDAQRQLDGVARGTDLRMISKADLARITLPVPDLETQQRIVTLNKLARNESQLLRRLADQRQQYISLVLAAWAVNGTQNSK